MKLFFDTEFTGLHQDTSLISIGIVANNEEKSSFYAEFTDYDKESVKDNEWIQNNVIKNLIFKSDNPFVSYSRTNDMKLIGNKSFVVKMLLGWIRNLNQSHYQLVSDVCHYDMVLFAELFGGAMNLPEYINPSCHDINQDMARIFDISEKEAFDLNREKIALNLGFKCNPDEKHNSLHDAKIIEYIYNNLK